MFIRKKSDMEKMKKDNTTEFGLVGFFLTIIFLDYSRILPTHPVSSFIMVFITLHYMIYRDEDESGNVVKTITIFTLIFLSFLPIGLYQNYQTDYKKALQETVVSQDKIENIIREQDVDNWEGNDEVLKVSYTKNLVTNSVTVTDKESIKLALHSKDKSKLKLVKVKYSFSNWFKKKYPAEPVPEGEYKIVTEGETK